MGNRVLIIEDNDDVRDLMVTVLEHSRHNVSAAANGACGLALARAQQPDLILCDLLMPGLSGTDVLREVRAHERTRATPFILVTGASDPLDDAGVPVLRKPFLPNQLLSIVARCARG